MILSAAFLISLGLSALKLLEIALSQKQQKSIQGWFETLALRLSYLDLSAWIAALNKTRVALALAAVTLICAYVFDAVLIGLLGGDVGPSMRYLLTRQWGIVVMQVALVLVLFPIELKWLVRSGKISSFLKKVGVIFSIYILFFLCSRMRHWDIYLEEYPRSRLLIIIPVVIPLSVCFYSAVYVLVIKLLQAGVFVCTRVIWRVVEYPKGAWTALLFIATALLGIAQSLMVGRH